MPLSNALRIPLYRMLVELRPQWSDAEVNDATVTLAKQDADPFTLVLQAVAQARKASNDRAVSITWPLAAEAVVRTLTTRLPDRQECAEHGGRTYRPDGTFACCWAEKAAPIPFEHRPSRPPVEALRLLELARNGSKEQQK